MAEVVDVVMAPAADERQQKRSFAADITNAGTTTDPPKKPKKVPKKKVLFRWSDKDKASKEARHDATILSPACRRAYGVTANVQLRHAPKSLSPNAAFYEHASPSAVDAAKARRSGVTLETKQPLKKRPLFGGMAHVSNARKAPANIVGVHEKNAAASALGNEMLARRKKTYAKGKQTAKGDVRAPSFSVWFDGKLVGKYKGDMRLALPDIKQKHPGEEFHGRMLQGLLGVRKRALFKDSPGLEKKIKASKFTAKYDSD